MPDKPIVETDPERMTRLDKIPMEQMSDEDRAFYIAHFERPDQQATLASEPEKSGDEQVTPAAQTEEIEIETSSEGEPEDETEDDDMARNNEKGGFAAQVKGFMNTHLFGGVQWSHIVAALLAVVALLLIQGAITSDTDELQEQISTLTTQRDFAQDGWNEANTTAPAGECACEFNASTEEAAVAAATAELEQDLADCQNETGGSAEVGTFDDQEMKDWISGSLKLQKTTIGTFELFESTDEALSYVSEVYAFNSAHNFKWNVDELGYAIADEHKDDDPAKAIFFGTKDVYIVLPSEDNVVIPEFYKLAEDDDEFTFEKVEPSSVSVVAVDKLEKSNNDD